MLIGTTQIANIQFSYRIFGTTCTRSTNLTDKYVREKREKVGVRFVAGRDIKTWALK
jgi:hypothetical protein